MTTGSSEPTPKIELTAKQQLNLEDHLFEYIDNCIKYMYNEAPSGFKPYENHFCASTACGNHNVLMAAFDWLKDNKIVDISKYKKPEKVGVLLQERLEKERQEKLQLEAQKAIKEYEESAMKNIPKLVMNGEGTFEIERNG
jgi:hypothetical protein